jgi:hypothetical protein
MRRRCKSFWHGDAAAGVFCLLVLCSLVGALASPAVFAAEAPAPLLKAGKPVDWWFVFKFNSTVFPNCSNREEDVRTCTFDPPHTAMTHGKIGLQFAYASSAKHRLQKGSGCAGETVQDPLGATFSQIFNGDYNYVVWNDQPYGAPHIPCGDNCGAPWGHSKGMLAWNEKGEGLVLQVSTPSWPLAASKQHPRKGDGNTLGCVTDDDVKLSQHFFALKLTRQDVVDVLKALAHASVVTDLNNPQLVKNGGPDDVQKQVATLGQKVHEMTPIHVSLSSGIQLIAKPSALHVPPWQMVSALLGGVSLRTATFWDAPKIPATTAATPIACWDDSLKKPGAVEIASTGQWDKQPFSLEAGGNHAKVGVSVDPKKPFVIFGDENQQGVLKPAGPEACGHSQNARGGLFFVLQDKGLADSVRALLKSGTAPAGK